MLALFGTPFLRPPVLGLPLSFAILFQIYLLAAILAILRRSMCAGRCPPLSALAYSLPTFLGMPMVDLPVAAANMAPLCACDLAGIVVTLLLQRCLITVACARM